ncbi:MAG: GNAT family N-acetyltransferase [Candidatus Heimdallarchaeota archaeon]|nr:GNAT family N-acetyltransferase [Candidatus Heimdallarchaeota archaeon]
MVKNLTQERIDEFVNYCVPPEQRTNDYFLKGMEGKKAYLIHQLSKFGSVAKIALNEQNEIIGMLQFQPSKEDRTVEIQCIFVREKEQQQKGVGTALLEAFIEEMKRPQKYFNNLPARAIITYAFEVPNFYPQHEFYKKMGFKQLREDDPFYLFYSLEKAFVYKPKISEAEFTPLPEDKNKALLFLDPYCPFSYYFAKEMERLIKGIEKDVEIVFIDIFKQKNEVKKRGGIVPFCVVNKVPIKTFFTDTKGFLDEVAKAFQK